MNRIFQDIKNNTGLFGIITGVFEIEEGHWTGPYIEENGQTVRYAEFTGTVKNLKNYTAYYGAEDDLLITRGQDRSSALESAEGTRHNAGQEKTRLMKKVETGQSAGGEYFRNCKEQRGRTQLASGYSICISGDPADCSYFFSGRHLCEFKKKKIK